MWRLGWMGAGVAYDKKEVADYFTNKASDYERWLAGLRRLQTSLDADPSGPMTG